MYIPSDAILSDKMGKDEVEKTASIIMKLIDVSVLTNKGKNDSFLISIHFDRRIYEESTLFHKTPYKNYRINREYLNDCINSRFFPVVGNKFRIELYDDPRDDKNTRMDRSTVGYRRFEIIPDKKYAFDRYNEFSSTEFKKRLLGTHRDLISKIVEKLIRYLDRKIMTIGKTGIYELSDYAPEGFAFSEFGMADLQNEMQIFSLGEVLVEEILKRGYSTKLEVKYYSLSSDKSFHVNIKRFEKHKQDNQDNLTPW